MRAGRGRGVRPSASATLLVRAALAVYPPSWRARYADEVRALLDDSGASPAAAAASGSLARATVKGGGPAPVPARVPVPVPARDPLAAPQPVGSGPARVGAPLRPPLAIPGVAGMLPRTRITNVVESSAEGTRRTDVPGTAARSGGNGAGSPRKMGRNERCWCGSGKKYKFCHGA